MFNNKIMLVDDEEAVNDAVHIILAPLGYEIIYCKDLNEAQNYFQEPNNHIDLIILDLKIADKSGMDFLDFLRDHNIETKVMVLSAVDSARAAKTAMKKGAADYITKPINQLELRNTVKSLLMNPEDISANAAEIR